MTDKNKHLECVLSSHKMAKEQGLVDKHISKRNDVKEIFEKEYGSKIYTPFNSGSYAKHTAINIKFDFDLVIPFKRNSFSTLEEMYDVVYKLLEDKYKDEINKGVVKIRKQKVSIGLEFIDGSDKIGIDVVPGRELNQDQYIEDNKLNLYVFSSYGVYEQGNTSIRTNIQAQIDNIKSKGDRDSIRKNIRLLKGWKVNHEKTAKSFFLELITIKAFDSKDIEGENWEQLKSVMEYIRDNVKTVALPDPGNSGNNVADTLTALEKSSLSDDMKFMVERIEENSDNIKIYFKINEKYPCEETDGNEYKIKKEGVSAPPPTRFG
ncbi:MAG TPA: nucleotidyltransferase [Bacteroidia bacterium]|nr:nucleotidyltransferase [Bacteroidia bacterium]